MLSQNQTSIAAMLWKTLLCGCIFMALTSCQQAVVILKAELPTFTMDPLPIKVGVVYEESVVNYTHEEEPPIGRSWTIKIGHKQRDLFRQTLDAMFAEVQEFDSLEAAKATNTKSLSGFILFKLKEFQFATPAQTHKKDFEIWVQYQVSLLDTNGSLLTEWLLAAYGKEATSNMRRPGQLMERALARALRDTSAAFIVNFPQLPEVKGWLKQSSVNP